MRKPPNLEYNIGQNTPKVKGNFTQNAEIAADLARRGVGVFPCNWHGEQAKAPMTGRGFKDARPSADPWDFTPNALVGMPIPAGVVVVDTDLKDGYHGDMTLEQAGLLEAADNACLTVETPSGGKHRWFSVDDPSEFSNTAGVNGLPCIDLRVAGKGYVIAPGCAYAAGEYRITKGSLDDLTRLAPMPPALVQALRRPKPEIREVAAADAANGKFPAGFSVNSAKHHLSASGLNFLELRLKRLFETLVGGIAKAPKGKRHEILIKNGRTLGGLISHAQLEHRAFDRKDVEAALFAACAQNGRIADDGENVVRLTINAAVSDGQAHPLLPTERRTEMKMPSSFYHVARRAANG